MARLARVVAPGLPHHITQRGPGAPAVRALTLPAAGWAITILDSRLARESGTYSAMFDDLQKRLSSAFGKFRARGLLTEENIKDGLREVRTALLEADVNYQVVQEFMAKVGEQAVGQQLLKSVRPEQQIVK